MKLKYLRMDLKGGAQSYLVELVEEKGALRYTHHYYRRSISSDHWQQVNLVLKKDDYSFSVDDWTNMQYSIKWITREEMFVELL